ncbi:DUF6894 family protein [Methylobacterium iners]|uniref:DUF6894 domain-containing protein n=1 Tax=Methylobacterium iners TaxID=418707 RepID=A0ABQ4RS64_9HYPH|nr:hypothetical protein [Methylobacterium iners]GJD93620.1 hypothetical protein OCOJLMKI_0816 [Methylobacterium iners]
MARYFFDVHDAALVRDEVGSECLGQDDIRKEAMLMLLALAKDEIPKEGDRQAFMVLVRLEANSTV